MKRYAIWDKESPMITPVGEVFTAQQWKEKYPVAGIPSITVICSAGEINGGFFGTLGQLEQLYMGQIDFSGCETPEEKLELIEAFEDAMNAIPVTPSAEERIAAALEYQVMASLPDEELLDEEEVVEDPVTEEVTESTEVE